MRYLRRSLTEVNHGLIKQFKLGERLSDVLKSLKQNVVPVIYALQKRITNRVEGRETSEDAACLEEVRGQWCCLLGDGEVVPEASKAISDVLSLVLEPPPEFCQNFTKLPAADKLNQKTDYELASKYRETLKKALEINWRLTMMMMTLKKPSWFIPRCLFQYGVDFECSFFNKNFFKNYIFWGFLVPKLGKWYRSTYSVKI